MTGAGDRTAGEVVHDATGIGLEVDAVVAVGDRRAVVRDDLAVVVDRGVRAGAHRIGIGRFEQAGRLVDDGHAAERRHQVVEIERLAVGGAGAGRADRARIVDDEGAGRGRAQGPGGDPHRVGQALNRRAFIVGELERCDVAQIGGIQIDAARGCRFDQAAVVNHDVAGARANRVRRRRTDDAGRGILDVDVRVHRGDGLEVERLTPGRRHGAGVVQVDGAAGVEVGVDAPGVVAGGGDDCTGIVVDGDAAAGGERAGAVDGARRAVDRAEIVDHHARGIRAAGPGDRRRGCERAAGFDQADVVAGDGFRDGVGDAGVDGEASHGSLLLRDG